MTTTLAPNLATSPDKASVTATTPATSLPTSLGTATPDHILQIGFGFWASKTLLSAVELDLFSLLSDSDMTADEIARKTGLHARSRYDFLDALVSLGLLARAGQGPDARYRNTADTALFLSRQSPAYVGGMLAMANARLYGFWGSLTEALRTGEPQNEIKSGAPGLFEGIYADPVKLEGFINGMEGFQLGAFTSLCATVDLSAHQTFCDIGGAGGALSAIIAEANPHLRGVTFDLDPVTPIARANLEQRGLGDRVSAVSGNFFVDAFPAADVYFMGNILHDWNEEEKLALMSKAFDALPAGGVLVAIENVIDDERRVNSFGLLMSLNMLIELHGGFDYTGAQFDGWARTAGFARTEIRHLAGPTSAAIAYKA